MSSAADAIRAVLQAADQRPQGGGRMKDGLTVSSRRKGADIRKLYSAKPDRIGKDLVEIQLEDDIQSSLLLRTAVKLPVEQIKNRVKVVAGASFTDFQLRKLRQLFENNKDADFATRRALAKDINTTEFQVRRWLENKKEDSDPSKSVDENNTAPKSRYFCSSESLSSSLGNTKVLRRPKASPPSSQFKGPQSCGTSTLRNARKVEIPVLSTMLEIQKKIDNTAGRGRRKSGVGDAGSGNIELINVEDDIKNPEIIVIDVEEEGSTLKDNVSKTALVHSSHEASQSRTSSPIDILMSAHDVITNGSSFNNAGRKTELTECKRKLKELENKYDEKSKLVNELEVRIPKMIREFNTCLNDKELALSEKEIKIKELKIIDAVNEKVVAENVALLQTRETKAFNVEKVLRDLEAAKQDAITSLEKCSKEKANLKSDLEKRTEEYTSKAESLNIKVSKLSETILKKDSEVIQLKSKLKDLSKKNEEIRKLTQEIKARDLSKKDEEIRKLTQEMKARDLSKKDEEIRKLTQEVKGLTKTISHMKARGKESEKKDRLTIDNQISKIKELDHQVKKKEHELREKGRQETHKLTLTPIQPLELHNVVDGHQKEIAKMKSTIKVLEKEVSVSKTKEDRLRLQLSDFECQGVTKSVELECVRNDVERLKKKLEKQKECRKSSVVEATKDYIEKLKGIRVESDVSGEVKTLETTRDVTLTNEEVWIDDEDEGALVINLEDEQDPANNEVYDKHTKDNDIVEVSINEPGKHLFPNPVKLLRDNLKTEEILELEVFECCLTQNLENEDCFPSVSFVSHVVTNVIPSLTHCTTVPYHLPERLISLCNISMAGHRVGIDGIKLSYIIPSMLSHIVIENKNITYDQVQTPIVPNILINNSLMFPHMRLKYGYQEMLDRKILLRSNMGRFGQKSWKVWEKGSFRRTVKRAASEDNCPIAVKMRRISRYDSKHGNKFIMSNLFLTQSLNSRDNHATLTPLSTNNHHDSPLSLLSHHIVPVSISNSHNSTNLVSYQVVLSTNNPHVFPFSLVSHHTIPFSTHIHHDSQSLVSHQLILSTNNPHVSPSSLVSHHIIPFSTNIRHDSSSLVSHQIVLSTNNPHVSPSSLASNHIVPLSINNSHNSTNLVSHKVVLSTNMPPVSPSILVYHQIIPCSTRIHHDSPSLVSRQVVISTHMLQVSPSSLVSHQLILSTKIPDDTTQSLLSHQITSSTNIPHEQSFSLLSHKTDTIPTPREHVSFLTHTLHFVLENKDVTLGQVPIPIVVSNTLMNTSSQFSHKKLIHGHRVMLDRKILRRTSLGIFGQKNVKVGEIRSIRRTVKREASADYCPIAFKMRLLSSYNCLYDDKFILSNLYLNQSLNSRDNHATLIPLSTNNCNDSPLSLVSHHIVPVSTNIPQDSPSLVSHQIVPFSTNIHHDYPRLEPHHIVPFSTHTPHDSSSLLSHQVVHSINMLQVYSPSLVSPQFILSVSPQFILSTNIPKENGNLPSFVTHEISFLSAIIPHENPLSFVTYQANTIPTASDHVSLIIHTLHRSIRPRPNFQPIVLEFGNIMSDFPPCALVSHSRLPDIDHLITPVSMVSHAVNLNLSLENCNKPKIGVLTPSDKDFVKHSERKRKLSPSPPRPILGSEQEDTDKRAKHSERKRRLSLSSPRPILESEYEVADKRAKYDCSEKRSSHSVVTIEYSLGEAETTPNLKRSRDNCNQSCQIVKRSRMDLVECSHENKADVLRDNNAITRSLLEIENGKEDDSKRENYKNLAVTNENVITSTLIALHGRLPSLCSNMPLVLYEGGNVILNKIM